MRPNYTLLKLGEALDKREKGSVVSQDLGRAFDTIKRKGKERKRTLFKCLVVLALDHKVRTL